MHLDNLAPEPARTEGRFLPLASRWLHTCALRCGVTHLPGNYRVSRVQVLLDTPPPGVHLEVSRADGAAASRYVMLPKGDFTSAIAADTFLVEAAKRIEAVMLMAPHWPEFQVSNTPSPQDFEFNCDPKTLEHIKRVMASVLEAQDEYTQAFMQRYWDKLRPEVRRV